MLSLFYCLLLPVRALKKIWKSMREGVLAVWQIQSGGGGGGGEKLLPSVRGVCIFSGITQWSLCSLITGLLETLNHWLIRGHLWYIKV